MFPGQIVFTPPPLVIEGIISVRVKSEELVVHDPICTVTAYTPPCIAVKV